MSSRYTERLKEFHEAFNVTPPSTFSVKRIYELIELRQTLMGEEFSETMDAMVEAKNQLATKGTIDKDTRIEILDGLTDQLVILFGTFHLFGWNADVAFERVMASNMSKLGEDGKPIYREDGKVLKGPNYHPPYLEDLV